jgi:hypothetical protein
VVRYGFSLWSDNAVTLWGVLVPIAIVAELIVVITTVATAPAGSTVRNGTIYVPFGSSLGAIHAVHWLSLVLATVVGVVNTGVAVRIFSESALGRSESASAALHWAWSRFGSLLWLSVIFTVALIVGTVLLIVPGIFVIVAFCVSLPALAIEGVRGGGALRRSYELTKGRWWATLGAVLPSFVLVVAGVVVIETTLRVSGSVVAGALAVAVGGLIIQALLVPVVTATSVAIYIDLRARKEPGLIETAPAHPSDLTPASAPPASPASPPSTGGDIWWS